MYMGPDDGQHRDVVGLQPTWRAQDGRAQVAHEVLQVVEVRVEDVVEELAENREGSAKTLTRRSRFGAYAADILYTTHEVAHALECRKLHCLKNAVTCFDALFSAQAVEQCTRDKICECTPMGVLITQSLEEAVEILLEEIRREDVI